MLKESSFWVETHEPIDFEYNDKIYRLYENEDSSVKSCTRCCFYGVTIEELLVMMLNLIPHPVLVVRVRIG